MFYILYSDNVVGGLGAMDAFCRGDPLECRDVFLEPVPKGPRVRYFLKGILEVKDEQILNKLFSKY